MNKTLEYLDEVRELLDGLPYQKIDEMADRIWEACRDGGQLLLAGNGGSGATASHLVADFQKGALTHGQRGFRVFCLSDNIPLLTAWSNDDNYDRAFAQQLRSLAVPGDVVLLLSGSGNSPNVVHAAREARSLGVFVFGLVGFGGGALAPLCDRSIVLDSRDMQQVEDVHMAIGHALYRRFLHQMENADA